MSKGNDIRCFKCGAKLAEANISEGFVSIKCKCGTINRVSAERDSEAPEAIIPLDRLSELMVRMNAGGKEKREFPPGGII